MISHSTSPVSHEGFEKENHLEPRAITRLTKEDNPIVTARRLLKGFGAISTVLLSAAALAPGTFGVPVNLRPWVFLIAIFWAIAFCAGMFDL